MAFERHSKRWYRPLKHSGRVGATINGKPAWLVAEERRKAAQEAARGDQA